MVRKTLHFWGCFFKNKKQLKTKGKKKKVKLIMTSGTRTDYLFYWEVIVISEIELNVLDTVAQHSLSVRNY